MSARGTALDALIACRKQAAWSNGVLKEYIERDRLDARDAALATRLCYGVIQHRSLLDHYLKQLLTGKIKDLHPIARDVLHLGLYQIYMLDRIPDSAAVNESVQLIKKYCRWQKNLPGLVNAVLRNAVRTKGSLKEPTSLAVKYSHPQALIDLLRENVGKERLIPMLEADNGIPETVLQVNTMKCTAEELLSELESAGIAVSAHPWIGDCLVMHGTGNLEKLPAFQEGKFYVQDVAAKLSVLCAEVFENAAVLDCCAAPGGKSFASAIAMHGTGSITSCDVHPHKAELIKNGAARLGFANITAKVQDATVENPEWLDAMDVVIADVPCSGYGIIRKKPDIRLKDPKEMENLPALQLAILQQQAKYVKKGGTLLYSTCTVLKRENEDVVAAFLRENSDFYTEKLTLSGIFPENTTGMLTLIPGQYDTDGFFICRMRRKA